MDDGKEFCGSGKVMSLTKRAIETPNEFDAHIGRYTGDMARVLATFDWSPVHALAAEFMDCWKTGRQVFICGNGGSAANAIHIANDCLYGISKVSGKAMKCHALPANNAVMTCLANDTGYENIFACQIGVLANPGDVLLVLSGSGNSPNILEAIKVAEQKKMKTYGVLGYSGGKAKSMVETPIHFAIDDMQISEDLQMVVAHIVTQWMYKNRHLVLDH
jgi:D-sedoheptulose 7-phosphate isomerase